MDYRAFEQRLLDTIFTTDVQLTPANIAFLYKISTQEASDLLQQAAVAGLLNIESDDEGNIIYLYPNRVKLPSRDGNSPVGKRGLGGGSPGLSTALARTDAASGALANDPRKAGRDLVVDAQLIDLTEAAGAPTGASAVTAPNAGSQAHAAEGPGPGQGQTTRCRFCSEVILVGAKKCKHCHEYLDDVMRDMHVRNQALGQLGSALVPVAQQQQQQQLMQLQQQQQMMQMSSSSSTQAALLSFFVPGLGLMCSGRVPAGLLWMMFTCLGYVCFIVPGIVLHILCVINAARQPRQLV